MLDFVFVAMFAVVPAMGLSIYLVRYAKNYLWHKRLQIGLGCLLLVAVAAFEIEMRLTGWRERAAPSPYYQTNAWNDPVHYSLAIHLFFAIPTAILWILVIVRGLRNFPSPPAPHAHSRSHRLWGRLAAFEMLMTAITGWIFYWLAFVAT